VNELPRESGTESSGFNEGTENLGTGNQRRARAPHENKKSRGLYTALALDLPNRKSWAIKTGNWIWQRKLSTQIGAWVQTWARSRTKDRRAQENNTEQGKLPNRIGGSREVETLAAQFKLMRGDRGLRRGPAEKTNTEEKRRRAQATTNQIPAAPSTTWGLDLKNEEALHKPEAGGSRPRNKQAHLGAQDKAAVKINDEIRTSPGNGTEGNLGNWREEVHTRSDLSMAGRQNERHNQDMKTEFFHWRFKHDHNRTTEVTTLPPSFDWNKN
jgi:hypothetical protein